MFTLCLNTKAIVTGTQQNTNSMQQPPYAYPPGIIYSVIFKVTLNLGKGLLALWTETTEFRHFALRNLYR